MKRKQIDAMREIRLWIGQVVIPAGLAVIVLRSNETTRNWIDDKIAFLKRKFKR